MNPIVKLMDKWEAWRKPAPMNEGEITTSQPFPGCVLLTFPNSFMMNWYMFRLQEFYESPEFAGKYFTVTRYMSWYAAREHNRKKKSPNNSGFDYLTRVIGLNIPGISFTQFYTEFAAYADHRPEEVTVKRLVLAELGTTDLRLQDFYVLANYVTKNKKDDALAHEVMHGRYYLDADYRGIVDTEVARNFSPALEKALLKRGYCRAVMMDEMHAFCLDGHSPWFPWWRRDKEARELQRRLRILYPQPKRKGGSRG